ncbi:hypothetical protein Gdia_2011 [Gluconacetobacter diazotrophicus PA1 5]|uniref:Uncharacterized protein n=1 Tax=Gluconacetobacter diazotrophicus TaxID=33996 RepID=A0A7W4NMY0_GLUDI|nr:hypothetical protein [Gluconacetobacter diazotrophicus]ACI51771.1 hypothetical protein Gdia_2011 [Gluconacetobacter diazotrophicus PA1 5]MBB2158158.1 hypothetical protein [Gluconacetobacter diazotrophicus]TWB11115.1 hypothetical protein FBZ86_101141 [Gluconacetobacter diazotrophicus]
MNALTLVLAAAAIVIGFSACEPELLGHHSHAAGMGTASIGSVISDG